MRVPDAVWASSLPLLTLQASFLLPPIGYALMITRGLSTESASAGPVARALAPFAVAQIMVLALVLAVPALVHVLEPDNARSTGTSDKPPDGDTLGEASRGKSRNCRSANPSTDGLPRNGAFTSVPSPAAKTRPRNAGTGGNLCGPAYSVFMTDILRQDLTYKRQEIAQAQATQITGADGGGRAPGAARAPVRPGAAG